MRVDLPDGQWAELRDPKLVPERLRRPVKAAAMALHQSGTLVEGDDLTPEQLAACDEFSDLVCVALVASWSFPEPVNADSLLELPGATFEALQAATAPMALDLLPDFGVSPDPKATTGASSSSSPSSTVTAPAS